MFLCHPDVGMDCYRLVTVWHHSIPCDLHGGKMPYPYEERRQLVLAVLRLLAADNRDASDPPAELECAADLLEEKAEIFAEAVREYREDHGN